MLEGGWLEICFVKNCNVMKEVRTFHCKIQPIFGIGIWLDRYYKEEVGVNGWEYNIILPFVRIQIGTLFIEDF